MSRLFDPCPAWFSFMKLQTVLASRFSKSIYVDITITDLFIMSTKHYSCRAITMYICVVHPFLFVPGTNHHLPGSFSPFRLYRVCMCLLYVPSKRIFNIHSPTAAWNFDFFNPFLWVKISSVSTFGKSAVSQEKNWPIVACTVWQGNGWVQSAMRLAITASPWGHQYHLDFFFANKEQQISPPSKKLTTDVRLALGKWKLDPEFVMRNSNFPVFRIWFPETGWMHSTCQKDSVSSQLFNSLMELTTI